ncbi:MAG: nitroreductase family protein [Actinomycetaceae bacterium]|nr:nitroreductase family protein [Actinomycetaceae bacterium]MDU0970612.1 nitroreductase family protein [Actinomycetaceae bacterium]
MSFVDYLEKRRTRYDLNDQLPISDEQVIQLVKDVAVQVPDAFNSQTQRAVVLLGDSHKRLWQVVEAAFEGKLPAEKVAGFAAGAGTILYYTDVPTVKGLQEQFPLFSDKFPVWAAQANGMLQYAVWTALANEGVGASIQHYNPVIDEAVRKEFDVPEGWQLVAQMVIGGINSEPGEKELIDINERVLTR